MVMDAEPRRDTGAAGTEIAIADELERQGHRVRRIFGDRLRHRIRHWNLHHLLEQPGTYRRAIRRALEEEPFDVLHVNQPAGWLAARENRRLGRSALFVHRSHGFEPRIGAVLDPWRRRYPEDSRSIPRRAATRLLARLLERNYRGIVRWADAHVVSCTECAEDLVARGVPADGVHVSPQVPIDEYLSAPAGAWEPERLRRLLFVGQHVFMKAPMVLAEALDRLFASDRALTATWVCEPEARDAVRARLSPASEGRTEILGWMPREALRDVFDRHGIFLFPSFTEGFGKVFLEAMARGLVVVSSDQGGARDVIRSGENGLLVPVGDAGALAEAVFAIAGDPERARRLSRAGRSEAERYTWRAVVERLVDFYRSRLAAAEAPVERSRR